MMSKILLVIFLGLLTTTKCAKIPQEDEEEMDFYSTDEPLIIPGLLQVSSASNDEIDVDSHSMETSSKHKLNEFFIDLDQEEWSDETRRYVEECETGQLSHNHDNTWQANECVTCDCTGSQLLCEKLQCPDLNCTDAVKVKGQCCPQCPEKLCKSHDGRKFKDGDEWHVDDCTYCECDRGNALCSVEDCQIPTCAIPIRVPGQCCPICPDGSCHSSNGSEMSSGSVWKEDTCTHCYCRGGERKCAEEKCPFVNCTDAFVRPGECCKRCPTAVDCIVSTWGVWGDCPIQECGGGMRRRYRSAVVEPIHGGSFCPHKSEAELCPQLSCDVLPVCPVTDWTPWSQCSATCGRGQTFRTRTKDKVIKATMLIDCSTTHMQETSPCDGGSCVQAEILQGANEQEIYDDICYEKTWTSWSACSVTCGRGLQRRDEVLLNENHPRGHFCRLLQEDKPCQIKKCDGSDNSAVNCKVSSWSSWSPCSLSCGPNGLKSKHRTVKRHSANGGRACPLLILTRPCKSQPLCSKTDPLPMYSSISSDHSSCIYGGEKYSNYANWQPSPCRVCTCVNGFADCTDEQCMEAPCSDPIVIPGVCCKVCLEDFQGPTKHHKIRRL